jgi:hypothetical protein
MQYLNNTWRKTNPRHNLKNRNTDQECEVSLSLSLSLFLSLCLAMISLFGPRKFKTRIDIVHAAICFHSVVNFDGRLK